MIDMARIPTEAQAEPDALLPRTEDGFLHAVRPQGMEQANAKAMSLHNKIARFYAKSHRLYVKLRFGGEIQYRWTFLSQLDIRRGDRVLEVSVGTGANLPILPAGARLYGIGVSPAMLREAARHLKEWGTEAELIHGEAEHLPFRSNSFDCVYRIGGLSESGEAARAVREMVRVAKSGTKILLAGELDRKSRISLAKKGEAKQPGMLRMLPDGMLDIRYEEVCKDAMYRLTFVKP